MIVFLGVVAAVCVVILMLSLCAAASGADEALARAADRALGPAAGQERARVNCEQDGVDDFACGVLLSLDDWRSPHGRRHTGGCS